MYAFMTYINHSKTHNCFLNLFPTVRLILYPVVSLHVPVMQHVNVVEFISSKMHNGVVVGHKRGLHNYKK